MPIHTRRSAVHAEEVRAFYIDSPGDESVATRDSSRTRGLWRTGSGILSPPNFDSRRSSFSRRTTSWLTQSTLTSSTTLTAETRRVCLAVIRRSRADRRCVDASVLFSGRVFFLRGEVLRALSGISSVPSFNQPLPVLHRTIGGARSRIHDHASCTVPAVVVRDCANQRVESSGAPPSTSATKCSVLDP